MPEVVHLQAIFDIDDEIKSKEYKKHLTSMCVGERPEKVSWSDGHGVFINQVQTKNAHKVLDLMDRFGVKSAGLSSAGMTMSEFNEMSNVEPGVIRVYLLNLK